MHKIFYHIRVLQKYENRNSNEFFDNILWFKFINRLSCNIK